MRHPGDTSAVAALFDAGAARPEEVVAILGKTEGNGCVNDFTRAYAVSALAAMLGARMGVTPEAVIARVALVMSGGTEGGLSPHFLVLAVREVAASASGALAIGVGFTPDFAPEEIGRMAQLRATAKAVRAAMADAGITDPGEVHYVQVKCPLITSAKVADAVARGKTVVTHETYPSMGLSRGAAALGVALALGEIAEAVLSDAAIGADWSLHSSRASCSAGVELERCEVIVLGNSPEWTGDLRIGHDVMQDAIDFTAVQRALASVGLGMPGQLDAAARARLVAVLAKAEPATTGHIRGLRHIMNDDSDINATRHARAIVGGVIAAAIGELTFSSLAGLNIRGRMAADPWP